LPVGIDRARNRRLFEKTRNALKSKEYVSPTPGSFEELTCRINDGRGTEYPARFHGAFDVHSLSPFVFLATNLKKIFVVTKICGSNFLEFN